MAVQAASDERLLEKLVESQKRYMLHCAYMASKRYITESDDEWSVTLSAFSRAVKTYSFEKGSFLSYAGINIKHGLIDYYRSQNRYRPEIPVDPAVFQSEPSEGDDDLTMKLEIASKLVVCQKYSVRDEIEAASDELKRFGFSFYEVAGSSPKSAKTKEVCRKTVLCILETKELFQELLDKKLLPISRIQKISGLPRKPLEHHRKYIIAAVVILSGEYPHLAEYVSYIRKGSA